MVGERWFVNTAVGTFNVDPKDERKGTGLRFATDTLLSVSSGDACRKFTFGVLADGADPWEGGNTKLVDRLGMSLLSLKTQSVVFLTL